MRGTTMPTPIPLPLRQQILTLHAQHYTQKQIAKRLHCHPRTVRRLLQRFLQHGTEGLTVHYDSTAHRKSSLPALWREELFAWAQAHPTWGAPYLRIQLTQRYPDIPWPSARTIQRWLAPSREQPASPGRKPQTVHLQATQVHQVWQVDAVDQLKLRSSQLVSWLRFVEEASGAILQTTVFSLRILCPSGSHSSAKGVSESVFVLGITPSHSRR
jgi:hypothetical protein